MGTGVAVSRAAKLASGLLALSLVAACGSEKREGQPLVATVGALALSTVAEARAGKSGGAAAPKSAPSRAEIEKAGVPVLRATIASRGFNSNLTILDSRADVVTWKTRDGTTFALRNGILIQTRGLGPDLMSSTVPSVGQLLQNGGTHERQYFFLGPNDQPTRRTYACTVSLVGSEEIEIVGRKHRVTHMSEDCVRPQSSKITNEFWVEGQTVRKSRQWASAQTGFIEFERVID